MLRRWAFCNWGAALLVLLQVACATLHSTGDLKKVRLLTGAQGNYYHSFGLALQRVMRSHGIEIELLPSSGSKSNLDRLSRNEAEFALVQGDAAHRAWYGEAPFTSAHSQLRMVAPLFTEKVQILTQPHLFFSSPASLKGKKIWLGPKDSGSELSAGAVLVASGFAPADVEASRTDIGEVLDPFGKAVELLKKGELVAVFQTRVAPNEPIRKACKQKDLRLLGLDWNVVEKLVADGSYIEASLQKSEYPQLTGEIFTVGVQTLLVTRDDVADDVVKTLAETLQQDQESIEAELHRVLVSKRGGGARIEPAKLTLLGSRPPAQLLERAHRAARHSLPNWPIRKEYVHDVLALAAVLGVIAIAGLFFPRHRNAAIQQVGRHVRVHLPIWLYVSGSVILLLIGAIWLRAVEGDINEHFATLSSSALYLAETILDKLPGHLIPIDPPVPTTRVGQTAMSWWSWIVLLPLTVFGPLVKRKLQKFLGSEDTK